MLTWKIINTCEIEEKLIFTIFGQTMVCARVWWFLIVMIRVYCKVWLGRHSKIDSKNDSKINSRLHSMFYNMLQETHHLFSGIVGNPQRERNVSESTVGYRRWFSGYNIFCILFVQNNIQSFSLHALFKFWRRKILSEQKISAPSTPMVDPW